MDVCSGSPRKSKRRCELVSLEQEQEQERNWAELPFLVLSCIMEKLRWEEDYLRFGATCVPWRTAFMEDLPGNANDKKHSSPPFLLIPPFVDWPNNQKPKPGFEIVARRNFEETRSFYSIPKNKVCDFQVRLPRNRYAVGSSLGWLVTMKPKRYGNRQVKYYVRLENPFLPHADHIHLPQLPFYYDDIHAKQAPYTYILKAALSSPPDANLNKNFILMLILSRDCSLAFFNPATKHFCWTPVADHPGQFSDVIYFKKTHQFYALLRHSGAVYAVDIPDHHRPNLTLVAPPTHGLGINCYLNRYIVESSSGDLLQLIKGPQTHRGTTTAHTRPWTINFRVLKFDFAMAAWVHIHNIGDAAFFIGANSSISRQASHFPNCKPNCIYFTNEYMISFLDMIKSEPDEDSGIYNLQDASIQSHYSVSSNKSFIAPIWLEPTSKN